MSTFLSGNLHAIFDVSLEETEHPNREARRAGKSDSDGETQAKTETVPLQNEKPSLPDQQIFVSSKVLQLGVLPLLVFFLQNNTASYLTNSEFIYH